MQALKQTMWIGFDLQYIPEIIQKPLLHESRQIFTELELAYIKSKKMSYSTMSGIIAAKEAFFKAQFEHCFPSYLFTDIEVGRQPNGRPCLKYHGVLKNHMEHESLITDLSISHSGDYAAATVLLYRNKQCEYLQCST